MGEREAKLLRVYVHPDSLAYAHYEGPPTRVNLEQLYLALGFASSAELVVEEMLA